MTQHIHTDFSAESVRREGIKLGVYLGILSLVISIVSLYVLLNATNFTVTSMITGGIGMVAMIALSAYFAVILRKSAGGFWSFSQALKGIFIMLAIGVIISSVGTTLFNLVNPEPQQTIFDKTINMTIETLESAGADDDLIDKQVADLEKKRDELRTFSFGLVLKALGVSLIMYFVFALILAAILKRERPAFLQVSNPADEAHPWQDSNK
ncbi:DUF4199 domain-containing protein [Sphingobacterium griseoflavum]|uniref:DUF4199 domain-containing protein n=1 Tax=Sphingobacterium griseoflavum TaxID=1474952 RepID=A0ABQ3HXY7_9SPHI|nr:DUF4199 domain-containing protein [Sphingobacterium griseoflavum]GHE30603.1 hypothetical protein GCM10017764_11910 [Sphingobacterium griseoflavum]